ARRGLARGDAAAAGARGRLRRRAGPANRLRAPDGRRAGRGRRRGTAGIARDQPGGRRRMTDRTDRLQRLTPAQRRLLELRMTRQRAEAPPTPPPDERAAEAGLLPATPE